MAYLDQTQYQILRDGVRSLQTFPAILAIRGELVNVTVIGYEPSSPLCLIVRDAAGRTSRPIPYTSLQVSEETAATLTASVEARESSRALATIYAMHTRHGRRIGGQYGGWRQGEVR